MQIKIFLYTSFKCRFCDVFYLFLGGDDRRVLLWTLAEAVHGKCTPFAMQTSHVSNIFCLGFDSTNSKIFSGGNDDQVIIHDTRT